MEFLWFLSQFRTSVLDNLFQLITFLGEETLLVVFICITYWCINKRMGYEMGFSFCISGLLIQGLKILFRIPRPWILDPDFKPVKSAVQSATGYSFPSGHTQSATSVYGTAAFNVRNKWLKVLYVILFLLVGLSRMYLGVHTPKDVVTAWILSLLVLWGVHFMFQDESRVKRMLILTGALCLGLFILGDLLYVKGVVEQKYVMDCCAISGAAFGFLVGYLFESKYVNFCERQRAGLQIGKTVVGLLLVLLLKKGLKYVFAGSLLGTMAQNFILILFIAYLYPLFFTLAINKALKGRKNIQ